MHPVDIVLLSTPVILVLVVAEMAYGRIAGRAWFGMHDTIASLVMGFVSFTAVNALFAFVTIDFFSFLMPYRVADIPWSVAAIVGCFFLDDFVHYWWHRTAHRMRWFWADHVQHHSSKYFNLSTGLRQSWTGGFTAGVVFRAPLVLVGLPLPMLFFVHSFGLVYQVWIHTEAIRKMPAWFEAIFNTPSHHRVHHATNPRYLDANYGGVLIIWDKMFGTFVAELDQDAPRYGVVNDIASYNPIRIVLHEWSALMRDVFRASSLREGFLLFFGPPGWAAKTDRRETTQTIKAKWLAETSAVPVEQ
jgi:sterol desaturase/sphingolipid hydroxylase (fatty acid hydroxylase superfamily)